MKVEINGAIFKRMLACESWEKPGEIFFTQGIFQDYGTAIFLDRHTIELEIPVPNTTKVEVQALEKKIGEVQKKADMQINFLKTAISNLLCIENGMPEKVVPLEADPDEIPF